MGKQGASDAGRTADVVFDPKARKEFLLGFHKRKLERRRFGLAMQKIKDRKGRLDERKERREAFRDQLRELGVDEDLAQFDIKEKQRESARAAPKRKKEIEFSDEHTQGLFGDLVTVTTTDGIPPDSDGEAEELAELRAEKRRRREENGGGADDRRWSLAAVTKRVAANMPVKKAKAPKRQGGSGGGGGGSGAAELLAKAKGVMRRPLGAGADAKGRKKKGADGKGRKRKR